MKTRQAIFLIILLIASAIGFYLKGYMDKSVVVLKNGSIIAADETWESGNMIFYAIESEVYLLNKYEVESYGEPDLKFILHQIKVKLSNLFSKTNAEFKDFATSTSNSIGQNLFLVVCILAATIVFIIILFVFHLTMGILHGRRNLCGHKNSKNLEDLSGESQSNTISRSDIIKYFLTLFRHQIAAEPDAPMEYKPLTARSSESNYVYELRIKHRGEWVRRRMTIGPLGEESGSKSKCFYVIYDAHLVVKIPVKPITKFDDYIESIRKEIQIVDKLAPKECITPKVSVILNFVHKLPESAYLPADKLEEKYVYWLRRNTDYQNHLKIKNTFVFFMDFSQYYFLGHIIDNLHDLKGAILDEIIANSETIFDTTKFRGRYGNKKESIGIEIRQVYNNCQAAIRQFLSDSGISSNVSMYGIQSWFLSHLAGNEVSSKDAGLPDNLVNELNRLVYSNLEKNKDAVKAYRTTIEDYVHKTRFDQDKPQISGIITNLLELLAWFRKKRIAMRDLKPDNLLVAGDPSKYPLFLMNAHEYELGIIDVETAVDFERSKYKKVKQPLLGGTPFYATPSHFFSNDVLQAAFNNLNKILHLQDWHATIVMIYKAITGDLLFEQSAKLFADIRNAIKVGQMDGKLEIDIVAEVSRMFWHSAMNEFRVKMNRNENSIKSIDAAIPENAKQMFKKDLVKDIKSTTAKIKERIDGQNIFESLQNRELLLKSSFKQIGQLNSDLENKVKSKRNPANNTSETIALLKNLGALKLLMEQQKKLLKRLEQPGSKISAYTLLGFMFSNVFKSMYKDDWAKPITNEDTSDADIDDATLEARTQTLLDTVVD